MTYNNERHKQLVKRFLDLRNQGKRLFHENRKEDFELNKYDGAVEEQLYWAHREEFIKLIKNFLTHTIDFDEFNSDFLFLYNNVRREHNLFVRDLEQIEKFQPSTRPEQFANIMSAFFRMLEQVLDEYITEQEAMNYIKETCLRSQIFKDEVEIWT